MNIEGAGALSQPRRTKGTMMTAIFKNAALALAVPGLALAAPAAAQPAAHAAAWNTSAVWSNMAQNHSRHRDSRYRDYGNGYRYQQTYYGEPVYANTRVWQGDDGRYYCRRSNGTTGLLIGAAGGALLGQAIVGRYGDRTLGAILGAAGGALLGRSIDKDNARCR
jgi:hypothetical protein